MEYDNGGSWSTSKRDLPLGEPLPPVTISDFSAGAHYKVTSFEGYAIEDEWRRLRPGESSDKYQNLSRPEPSKPLPTVTALGGSSPGTASEIGRAHV